MPTGIVFPHEISQGVVQHLLHDLVECQSCLFLTSSLSIGCFCLISGPPLRYLKVSWWWSKNRDGIALDILASKSENVMAGTVKLALTKKM